MQSFPPAPCRRTTLAAVLALAATSLMPAIAAADDAAEKILVLGDSQAQGLAGGVQRLYRADRRHRVIDRSKISTGLVPRASYDWPSQARTISLGDRADVAVALFGANDRPPVRVGGRVDAGLLDRFEGIYGTHVAEVAQSFRSANVPLIWLGHPIVRDAAYAEDMAVLNGIYAARAAAEGAVFISTWEIFQGPDGGYSPYGKGVDGQITRLRADDGVHMTPAGYDVIAALLAPTIEHYRPASRIEAAG